MKMYSKRCNYAILISLILIPLTIKSGNYPKLYSPFHSGGTEEIISCKMNVISFYGDFRYSEIRGHRHSGIDIEGNYGEKIFPITEGKIIKISSEFPHKAVYILHLFDTLEFISVYMHVEDIKVRNGDYVNETIEIGRIFNNEELSISAFCTPPHLHFEIRRNLNDNGEATFACMTINELNKHFIDPITFIREGLKCNE